MLHQHIFLFARQGDQNGKGTVTYQLRLSENPPTERDMEQLSSQEGRNRWETNRLSVSVALQSGTYSPCGGGCVSSTWPLSLHHYVISSQISYSHCRINKSVEGYSD